MKYGRLKSGLIGDRWRQIRVKLQLPSLLSWLSGCYRTISFNLSTTMKIIRKPGFKFGFDADACDLCPGLCCFGEPGVIWITSEDIKRISEFLSSKTQQVIEKYLRRIDDRYSLRELRQKSDYYCIFFDAQRKSCSIYPVRPTQCRQYPFWPNFKENRAWVGENCPGIVADYSRGSASDTVRL